MKKLGIRDVPTRDVLTRRCLPDANKIFFDLKVKATVCEQAVQFTVTSDIWTDDVRRISYACFTLHYASNFESKEILLNIQSVSGSHTGELIASLFR